MQNCWMEKGPNLRMWKVQEWKIQVLSRVTSISPSIYLHSFGKNLSTPSEKLGFSSSLFWRLVNSLWETVAEHLHADPYCVLCKGDPSCWGWKRNSGLLLPLPPYLKKVAKKSRWTSRFFPKLRQKTTRERQRKWKVKYTECCGQTNELVWPPANSTRQAGGGTALSPGSVCQREGCAVKHV